MRMIPSLVCLVVLMGLSLLPAAAPPTEIPGEVRLWLRQLADNDVNIEYCYCATSPEAKKGLLILRVSNAKKALKLLNTLI